MQGKLMSRLAEHSLPLQNPQSRAAAAQGQWEQLRTMISGNGPFKAGNSVGHTEGAMSNFGEHRTGVQHLLIAHSGSHGKMNTADDIAQITAENPSESAFPVSSKKPKLLI